MKSNSALLECRDLSCGYRQRPVLTGVNLELWPGRVLALLGPNGSGKSTLLKTLSGTLPPLGGEALYGGAALSDLRPGDLAKRVAYVPQEESFAFAFLVREIVMMGRMPHSAGLADTALDHERVSWAMDLADCTHLAPRSVLELSGGERQRVLIARALAQDTRVLLLDEPTSHLDVGHQVEFAILIRRLSREGYTVIAAVHDLNLASTLADEAVLLREGTIGMTEKTEDVLSSTMLAEVYGVEFSTVRDENGALRVFAKAPITI
jgi:iron complex transport system ATP-binding protein